MSFVVVGQLGPDFSMEALHEAVHLARRLYRALATYEAPNEAGVKLMREAEVLFANYSDTLHPEEPSEEEEEE